MSRVVTSGALVCRNAEGTIVEVLSGLAQSCDEVVVFDLGSTDRTVELAVTCARVRLYEASPGTPWLEAWNRAVDQCLGDWVLAVCGSERLHGPTREELARKLRWTPRSWFRVAGAAEQDAGALGSPGLPAARLWRQRPGQRWTLAPDADRYTSVGLGRLGGRLRDLRIEPCAQQPRHGVRARLSPSRAASEGSLA